MSQPIALLTPMANPTVEREMRQLLPASCDYLVGRLVSTEEDPTARLRAYAERLDHALAQFGTMDLGAVAFACTASSYLVGRSGEERIAARVGVPILWAAQSVLEALKRRNARRIAVISPYPEAIHAAGLTYWRDAGLDVIHHDRVETGSSDTRAIYALGATAAATALAGCRKVGADAVLLAGTGMPTLDLLSTVGELPVLSSNYCLALAMTAQQENIE